MPLKQRLPKFGFTSQKSLVSAEVRLHELAAVNGDVVDLGFFNGSESSLVPLSSLKVVLSGEITRPVTVKGLGVTKGARAAIEAAGGKVEE
ncbi:50S ribosomal protein L15 [Alishewanella longhuensis]